MSFSAFQLASLFLYEHTSKNAKGCPLLTRPPPYSPTSTSCLWSSLQRTISKMAKRMRRTSGKENWRWRRPTCPVLLFPQASSSSPKPQVQSTDTKNLKSSDGIPYSPYLEAVSERVTIMLWSILLTFLSIAFDIFHQHLIFMSIIVDKNINWLFQ